MKVLRLKRNFTINNNFQFPEMIAFLPTCNARVCEFASRRRSGKKPWNFNTFPAIPRIYHVLLPFRTEATSKNDKLWAKRRRAEKQNEKNNKKNLYGFAKCISEKALLIFFSFLCLFQFPIRYEYLMAQASVSLTQTSRIASSIKNSIRMMRMTEANIQGTSSYIFFTTSYQ